MMGRWISRDEIEVPATAEADDGMIGDGLQTIGPDDPRWDLWAEWLERSGEKRPS